MEGTIIHVTNEETEARGASSVLSQTESGHAKTSSPRLRPCGGPDAQAPRLPPSPSGLVPCSFIRPPPQDLTPEPLLGSGQVD